MTTEFNIVIPVYNAGPKIAVTLHSILQQTAVRDGSVTIRCFVVDGASTDDTLNHVQSFDDPRIEVLSEPDTGMYDALAKGLAWAKGDVTCYMPAGEQFDPHAFAIVARIFTKFEQISWLTGRSVTRNEAGEITDSLQRHPFKRAFIACGMYGTRLTAIQQESTFWRSCLNTEFDFAELARKKLAGDYYLWHSLARKHELYAVNAHLGAFTIEQGQLSQRTPGAYRKELRSIRRKPSFNEHIGAILHRKMTKNRLPRKKAPGVVWFDHDIADWRLGDT